MLPSKIILLLVGLTLLLALTGSRSAASRAEVPWHPAKGRGVSARMDQATLAGNHTADLGPSITSGVKTTDTATQIIGLKNGIPRQPTL